MNESEESKGKIALKRGDDTEVYVKTTVEDNNAKKFEIVFGVCLALHYVFSIAQCSLIISEYKKNSARGIPKSLYLGAIGNLVHLILYIITVIGYAKFNIFDYFITYINYVWVFNIFFNSIILPIWIISTIKKDDYPNIFYFAGITCLTAPTVFSGIIFGVYKYLD